jgi:hypothetical protein
MEIIILCDQTDCTFNIEGPQEPGIKYSRGSRDNSTNRCTNPRPAITTIIDFSLTPPKAILKTCHSKDKRVVEQQHPITMDRSTKVLPSCNDCKETVKYCKNDCPLKKQ